MTYEPLPAWLSNPDMAAPCPCGRPPIPGEPIMIVQGDHDLKRWVHASCAQGMVEDSDGW